MSRMIATLEKQLYTFFTVEGYEVVVCQSNEEHIRDLEMTR